MTMTGPAELKDRMVALWASHAEWMKASHHRGGDKACLFYHQCISEEMNDFTKGRPELGAGAEPTGNVTITCIEFYATKEGLDEHFKLFHAGDWKGGEEFGALMGTGKVSFAGAGYGETLVSVARVTRGSPPGVSSAWIVPVPSRFRKKSGSSLASGPPPKTANQPQG